MYPVARSRLPSWSGYENTVIPQVRMSWDLLSSRKLTPNQISVKSTIENPAGPLPAAFAGKDVVRAIFAIKTFAFICLLRALTLRT